MIIIRRPSGHSVGSRTCTLQKDGIVRVVTVHTQKGPFDRPVVKLRRLPLILEIDDNDSDSVIVVDGGRDVGPKVVPTEAKSTRRSPRLTSSR